MSKLLERLRQRTKDSGLFERTSTMVGYSTGFLPFDYANGYIVQARDDDDKLISEFTNLGIVGGTTNTVIGKSGTAKSTAVIQWSAAIVRPFENGLVIHIDLEQALNYTRIKNITGYSNAELKSKYILKQEKTYIEDIYDMIIEIANEKEAYKKDYTYMADFKNEFNEPVELYVPTIIVIDSLPTLSQRPESKKDKESGVMLEQQEMGGNTRAMRTARALAGFYKSLMPILKKYNITIFSINHINKKIEVSSFVPTAPQLLWLKMDESLPLGNTPLYYANNLLKFVAIGSEKANKEDDGYNGFTVDVQFLKSRTNVSGQSIKMIYDQEHGFDKARTMLRYLKDNGYLMGARKDKRYIKGFEDVKFNERNFREEFETREDVREVIMKAIKPLLEYRLNRVDSGDVNNDNLGLDPDTALEIMK